MSFKRLQTEKAAADRALSELTPLQTIQEIDALREYLQNVNLKAEVRDSECPSRSAITHYLRADDAG